MANFICEFLIDQSEIEQYAFNIEAINIICDICEEHKHKHKLKHKHKQVKIRIFLTKFT